MNKECNRHGKPWEPEEDDQLVHEFLEAVHNSGAIQKISDAHSRTYGAIRSRLEHLQLLPYPGKFGAEIPDNIGRFWMIIKLKGMGSEQTRSRHPSEDEAIKEAERLASNTRSEFVLLESKAVCKPREILIDWKKL